MKYQLPREFAEKWVVALRSGKYEQGLTKLRTFDAIAVWLEQNVEFV